MTKQIKTKYSLATLAALVGATLLSGCGDAYHPFAAERMIAGQNASSSNAEFTAPTFYATGTSRWAYDPQRYYYYDNARKSYYDQDSHSYFPPGYKPGRRKHGHHPRGLDDKKQYCPPPPDASTPQAKVKEAPKPVSKAIENAPRHKTPEN